MSHIRPLGAIAFMLAVSCLIFPIDMAYADITGRYATIQPTWIAYINLTQTGKKAAGYIQYVYADSNAITKTYKSDIHGEVNGSKVALTLIFLFGDGNGNVSGNKKGANLVLEFPAIDGRIQVYTFTQTSVKAWNQSVTLFRKHWARSISVARTNTAIAARKGWLLEQNTKIITAVFDKQKELAGELNTLSEVKSNLQKWQKEAEALQKTYAEAKSLADKKIQGASNDDERSQAWELQSQAQDAKSHVDEVEQNIKSLKRDTSSIFDKLDADKADIKQEVSQYLSLRIEMKGYKMQLGEAPEFGKYMAIVITPSAKVRAARALDSDIVREVREGAYLGVNGLGVGVDYIVLADGQCGVINKTDLRLISLDSIGRQKIGRLGTVTTLETSITKEPNEHSASLATAKRDEFLCITEEREGWYGVLMQNGFRGWVKRETVRLLDNDVIRDEDGKLNSPGAQR